MSYCRKNLSNLQCVFPSKEICGNLCDLWEIFTADKVCGAALLGARIAGRGMPRPYH